MNIGCGKETYGDVRIDIIKTPAVTQVVDITQGLPFEDNSFDKVYCRKVLEHMKNPFNLILEMKRVCKEGGEIYIDTDNAGYIMFHIFKKDNNNYHGNYNWKEQYGIGGFINEDRHYMLFTKEHLRNLLTEAGFKNIEGKYDYDIKTIKGIILNFFLGERFAKPSVIIGGIK